MLGKIIAQEYPFLRRFLEKNLLLDEQVTIEKLQAKILNEELYYYAHSWAGSQGTKGWIILKNGDYEELQAGHQYSDNGRIVVNEPAVEIWENFIDDRGVNYQLIEKMEALVIREWDHYDNPSNEYEEWTIYIKPQKVEIREKVEESLRGQLEQLRKIVE